MNRTETAQALVLAQAYDNRSFGESTIVAWSEVMSDLRFADVASAIKAHYRDSDAFLMPAHIRAKIRAHYQPDLYDNRNALPHFDGEVNERGLAAVRKVLAEVKLRRVED